MYVFEECACKPDRLVTRNGTTTRSLFKKPRTRRIKCKKFIDSLRVSTFQVRGPTYFMILISRAVRTLAEMKNRVKPYGSPLNEISICG
jgi:hypothetical protein